MAVRPESIEEWCQLVPHLLSEEGWQTILQNPSSGMFRSSSPWNTTLTKFVLRDLHIIEPPDDPADLLIRPETRAWSWQSHPEPGKEACEVQTMLAPGDCLVRWWADWKLLQLWDALFGTLYQTKDTLNFGYRALPVETREKMRRNYPEKGDCSLGMCDVHQLFDSLMLTRLQTDGRYSMQLIFAFSTSLPSSVWTAPHFRLAVDELRAQVISSLNRPWLNMERRKDQSLYMVVTITSFSSRSSFPMIPIHGLPAAEDVTKIDAGKGMDLTMWVRYDPALVGSSNFWLSQYLQKFLEGLGETSVKTYQSLDGQILLPYQCAVMQNEWSQVRDRFKAAFILQRSAYRRTYGGTAAPKFVEGVKARFRRQVNLANLAKRAAEPAKPCNPYVVRKTFVELDDVNAPAAGASCVRHRTVSPIR